MRQDRARDRALARKLRQHDAETCGWHTVGKAPAITAMTAAPIANAALPTVIDPPDTAQLPTPAVKGAAEDGAELSRSQKRMQRRKEKARAKRAETVAAS